MSLVRHLNGLLLLDKASGLSSNAALQRVKRLLQAKKAGHTGSLDPLATGMLPIFLGEATKFSQFLLQADKTYVVEARLGVTTATADSEGDVIATASVPSITETMIEAVLNEFRGDIKQVPPMFSALKYQGQPLYKLARQGQEVERSARAVTISQLKLLRYGDDYLQLRVACSKGTYIRSLVADIGERLTCGAHVVALRRLQVAEFQAEQMVNFERLEQAKEEGGCAAMDAYLVPMQHALRNLPSLTISDTDWIKLKQGQLVMSGSARDQGFFCLLHLLGGFLGVGEILADGRLAPKRVLSQVA